MSLPDYRASPDRVQAPEALKPTIYIGTYQPRTSVFNQEIESWGVKTASGKPLTAEGIENLIGVKRRFVAQADETPLAMGLSAVDKLGINFADVVLFSTSFPTGQDLATEVSETFGLGTKPGGRINIHMACSGFVAGLSYLHQEQERLQGARILMINSERYHPFIKDLRDDDALTVDPGLCQTIFSDYATAMTFTLGEDLSILGVRSEFDFKPEENNFIRMPIAWENLDDGGIHMVKDVPPSLTGKIYQDGHNVFKTMIRKVPRMVEDLVGEIGIPFSDVSAVLTHQGSLRMTTGISEKLHPDLSHVRFDQEDGNVSSAAIPRLMKREIDEGRLFGGDTLVLAGFGGGLMASTAVIRLGKVA